MIHSRHIDLYRTPNLLLPCSMDPISAIGSALFGIIPGMAMGAAAGGSSAAASSGPQTPPTPSQAAPATQTPVGVSGSGQKAGSGGSNASPSFVGSAAVPAQSGYGGKTLLGQ